MVHPPNTVKTYGKRLYSPLGLRPKQTKKEGKPYVIGICGGPSSGKSSVAKFIKQKLPHAVILNLIHFYKPIRGNLRRRSRANSIIEDQEKDVEEIKLDIRDAYRNNDFDSPDAIDWALMNKGVKALVAGQPFNKPIYDDETMIRTARTEHVKPSSVVIIEGHLIFCNEELMKMMDLKVFIDTDDDVRLSRRVLKMSRKHPNDSTFLNDILQKYENYVKPSFEKFIEPTKKYADIILPNYGFSTEDKLDVDSMNIPAIDLIIKRVLSEQF
jgi:uridine kinase